MYNGTHGTGTASGDDAIGSSTPDATPEEVMLGRVKSFAENMLRMDKESVNEDNKTASRTNGVSNNEELQPKHSHASHRTELMSKFQHISSSTLSDLFDEVHSVSMCLEGTDKGSIKCSASGI